MDQAENIAFTSLPVLSEKFSLHRQINYEHQILFEKKMSFRTRVAAQNLARVELSSLNRLTYSLTPRRVCSAEKLGGRNFLQVAGCRLQVAG